jgi:hypothetical protein
VYTTQQAANITALEAALASGGGSGGEATTYAIINNLAYVTTNNPATVAEKDSEYIAILTVVDGYALDTVTVEMGGVDITASAYLNGEIYIPSVTGAVVITATAVATGTEEPPASGWVYDSSKWLVGYGINATTGEVEENLKSAIYDEYIKNATSVTLTTKEYSLHLRIKEYDENKAYLGAANSVTANSSNNYQVTADIKSGEYIKITVAAGHAIEDFNAIGANLEVEF